MQLARFHRLAIAALLVPLLTGCALFKDATVDKVWAVLSSLVAATMAWLLESSGIGPLYAVLGGTFAGLTTLWFGRVDPAVTTTTTVVTVGKDGKLIDVKTNTVVGYVGGAPSPDDPLGWLNDLASGALRWAVVGLVLWFVVFPLLKFAFGSRYRERTLAGLKLLLTGHPLQAIGAWWQASGASHSRPPEAAPVKDGP